MARGGSPGGGLAAAAACLVLLALAGSMRGQTSFGRQVGSGARVELGQQAVSHWLQTLKGAESFLDDSEKGRLPAKSIVPQSLSNVEKLLKQTVRAKPNPSHLIPPLPYRPSPQTPLADRAHPAFAHDWPTPTLTCDFRTLAQKEQVHREATRLSKLQQPKEGGVATPYGADKVAVGMAPGEQNQVEGFRECLSSFRLAASLPLPMHLEIWKITRRLTPPCRLKRALRAATCAPAR